MATEVMPSESTDASSPKSPQPSQATSTQSSTQAKAGLAKFEEPSVRSIIDAARKAPAPARGTIALSTLTGVTMWASFMPLNWSPLAWVCLVPLILLVRIERPTRKMYWCAFGGGLMFTISALQWMRLGDASMIPAWFALAAYMALYFPLFLLVTRIAVLRFKVPLTLAVPIVWTGTEYLRGTVMTGFAWYFLAHTQYRWTGLIQISDVVGAYGVSFVMSMMAACIALLIPSTWIKRLGLLPPTKLPDEFQHLPDEGIDPEEDHAKILRAKAWNVAVCLIVFASVLIYGEVRTRQAKFEHGPRIALIQGNFPSSLKHNTNEWPKMFQYHDALTGMAVAEQPDIIVWPETMFRWPLRVTEGELSDEQLLALVPGIENAEEEEKQQWTDSWKNDEVPKTLNNMSTQAGAAMIIGIDTLSASPSELNRYNSAVFVRPDTGVTDRYDKIHRVVFGEYIPLKDEIPWLHRLTPFSAGHGIQKGERFKVFDYNGYRMAPVICFEDTVPQLIHRLVRSSNQLDDGKKPLDCLINITNDGWFHDSAEIEQHLFTSVFRCVECRTPMVRAVNTGISAFIDGNGNVIEPDAFIDGERRRRKAEGKPARDSMKDANGTYHKSLNAALVSNIPLDNRSSLYVKHGDWFAGSTAFLAIFVGLCGFLPRRNQNITDSPSAS